ncbi:MAG: LuxR C-terminal-related transcriptional regulator, partial [Pseudomonadota bacterium]
MTPRSLSAAEGHTPLLLRRFLADLEDTENTLDVWQLLVALGRDMDTPFIDFITAASWQDWKKTLFIRTSYDSSWLNEINKDPEIGEWSIFRSHAIDHLTPVVFGHEFSDLHPKLPASRRAVLETMAGLGLRAGFAVPLRLHAPPQAGIISFVGDHDRAEFERLIAEHGWTMTMAALVGHQKYMTHFNAEFSERNEITEKQRVLLRLIGSGLQDKHIAHELGISISAVRQRMAALQDKTGLANRTDLAALAMSLGIVPDPLNRPG